MTAETKAEALRLLALIQTTTDRTAWIVDACIELRRLHEQVEQLQAEIRTIWQPKVDALQAERVAAAHKVERDALIDRVAELEKDAEELSFLKGDLLHWIDRAVGKGNANCDIEEAQERYNSWSLERARKDAA